MNFAIVAVAVLINFFGFNKAFADFDCPVKMNAVLIYIDGSVNISHTGRNDYTILCNIKTAYKGVDPSVCAFWTATLNSLKMKGLQAYFKYPGTGSCSNLPTYDSAPIPIYVGNL